MPCAIRARQQLPDDGLGDRRGTTPDSSHAQRARGGGSGRRLSVAHAEERNTVLSVGGMAGGVGDFAAPGGPDEAWGTRDPLAWERPLIEMPTSRGYKIAVRSFPSSSSVRLVLDEQQRADGYLGAGIRAELQISQREMGLMRISARGAGYVAPWHGRRRGRQGSSIGSATTSLGTARRRHRLRDRCARPRARRPDG